jgi:hypothetical protein
MPEQIKEQACPKCRAPYVQGAEYCVCGHKWGEVKDWFNDVFGDMFNDKKGNK